MKNVLARLDAWWTGWGSLEAIGVGLLLAVAGLRWSPLVWAGWTAIGAAVVVNVGYGVALASTLLRRKRGKR